MGMPPTGKKIEVNEIHIYRLKDGKAVEHRVGRDDLGGDAPARCDPRLRPSTRTTPRGGAGS